jgi:hypothetical protein
MQKSKKRKRKKLFLAGIGVLCILFSIFAGIVLAQSSESINYWDYEGSEFLNYNSIDLVNSTNVSIDIANGLVTLDYSGNIYQNNIEGENPLTNLYMETSQYSIEITNETYYSPNHSIQMKTLNGVPYEKYPFAHIQKAFPCIALDITKFFVFETAIKREFINQSQFYIGINGSFQYAEKFFMSRFCYIFESNQKISLFSKDYINTTNITYFDEWYKLKIIVENATLKFVDESRIEVTVSFYLNNLLINTTKIEFIFGIPADEIVDYRPKTNIFYYLEDTDAWLDDAWIDDIKVSTTYYQEGYLYSKNIPDGYEISNITYNATIPENTILTVEYNESLNILIAYFTTRDLNITPILDSWNIIFVPKLAIIGIFAITPEQQKVAIGVISGVVIIGVIARLLVKKKVIAT